MCFFQKALFHIKSSNIGNFKLVKNLRDVNFALNFSECNAEIKSIHN